MSSLIGISKYLFCPVCFRNKKRFFTLKCYIVEDQIHLCECIYCKNYWETRALKEEFERLEEEIETFEIQSSDGIWNFRKQSLEFRNKVCNIHSCQKTIKTYDKRKFAGFEYIFHFMGKQYTRRKSYIMQDGKFKFLFKIKVPWQFVD